MSRTFPSGDNTLVYEPPVGAGTPTFLPGTYVTIYTDAGGSTVADDLTLTNGVAFPDGRLLVDATSRIPRFIDPQSRTKLYARPDGSSLVTTLYADPEESVAAIVEAVSNSSVVQAAAGAAAADAALTVLGTAADLRYVGKTTGRLTPLEKLTNYRKRRSALKNVTGPTGVNGEITLLEIPGGVGAGMIEHLWLQVVPQASGTYPNFDHRLRVYTDGNGAPDLEVDLGLLFGMGNAPAFPEGNLATEHFYHRTDGAAATKNGGGIRLPMPFDEGITITLLNPNDSSPAARVFFQADYTLQSDTPELVIPPYRLRALANPNTDTLEIPETGQHVIHTTSPGRPGVIVAHSMTGSATGGVGTPGLTYLERPVALYADGETDPFMLSSGLEDWFLGSYYWGDGETPSQRPGAMALGALNTSPYIFSALLDMLALNGGFYFAGSFHLDLMPHADALAGLTYASALFYYLRNF